MTTVAWWHCYAGIAGDMALGSLVDAGADLDEVRRHLEGLPVDGWRLEAEPVLRAGLAATHVTVTTSDSPVVRTHSHIAGMLEDAELPPRVRRRALEVFGRLAEVEGRLHRRPPAQVHFHEVGSTDAIVDVVGTCLALELLGIDEVRASPVAQGRGLVRSAHGVLPVPVPAVVELLRGAPTYGTTIPLELTTPTGAALLAALASGWGPLPSLEITATGYGAGTRELDGLPNSVQVVIGTAAEPPDAIDPDHGQPVAVLEANVDDVTGEVLADTVAAVLAAGALDAWVTPIVGKKGRPAHVVSVLADPAAVGRLRGVLAAETGTLGVRAQAWHRWPSARDMGEVEVDGHVIRVKRGPQRIKAEHDDAARVAALLGLPVREVARRAEELAYARFGRTDPASIPPPSTDPAGSAG